MSNQMLVRKRTNRTNTSQNSDGLLKSVAAKILIGFLIIGEIGFSFVPQIALASEVGYNPASTSSDEVVVDGIGKAATGKVSVATPSTPSSSIESVNVNKGNVDLGSGAFTYSYPILLPEGRAGLTPSLNLNYDSRVRNYTSYVGVGWTLDIPSISRLNKRGADIMFDYNDFSSSTDGELTKIDTDKGSAGTYGVKNGYGRYTFEKNNSWTYIDKTGTTYTYGENSISRTILENDPDYTVQWYLSKVTDVNGNWIQYTYDTYNGIAFPVAITYSDNYYRVRFSYDSFEKNGVGASSIITTNNGLNRLLKSIDVIAVGNTVRSYSLGTTNTNGVNTLGGINLLDQNGQNMGSQSFSYTANPTISLATGSWVVGYSSVTDPTKTLDFNSIPIIYNTTTKKAVGQWAEVAGDENLELLQLENDSVKKVTTLKVYSAINGKYQLLPAYSTISSSTLANFLLIDANNDGATDIFAYECTYNQSVPCNKSTNYTFYKNTGTGFTKDTSLIFPDSIDMSSGRKINVIDIDNDGRMDLVTLDAKTGLTLKTYLNSGSEFVYDPKFAIVGGPGTTNPTNPYYTEASPIDFKDVNGDGLSDLIIDSNIYINRLGQFQYSQLWKGGTDMTDLNGDGILDATLLVNNQPNYYFNTLKGVKASTNSVAVQGLPNSIATTAPLDFPALQMGDVNFLSLPNTVSQNNGATEVLDINADGFYDMIDWYNQTKPTIKLYAKPRAFLLSTITNEFGGSTQIAYKQQQLKLSQIKAGIPDVQTVVDKISYNPNSATGTSTFTYTYESGLKFHNAEEQTTRMAVFKKVTATTDTGKKTITYFHQGNTSDTTLGENDDHSSKIGKIFREETYGSDGAPVTTVITKWTKSDLGSGRFLVVPESVLTRNRALGYDTAKAFTYDTSVGEKVREYSFGIVNGNDDGTFTDSANDKVVQSTVFDTNGTLVVPLYTELRDIGNTLLSKNAYEYDNGNLSKGLLTSSKVAVTENGYHSTNYVYNSKGLVTKIIDPRNATTTIDYDRFSLKPTAITNSLGQKTLLEYNYGSGQPSKITNSNGSVTEIVYDALNRPIRTSIDGQVRKNIQYNIQQHSVNITTAFDTNRGTEEYGYFDGFGRINQQTGPNGFQTFAYNSNGELTKKSLGGTNTVFETYSYLPNGLLAQITNPDGTSTITYNALTMKVTDPEGRTTETTKDAFGRVTLVNQGSSTLTKYDYNSAGNLTKITDADGNIRTQTFDMKGQKISFTDLHRSDDTTVGEYKFLYDQNGNITTEKKADDTRVKSEFDSLNRKTKEYINDTASTVYTYDACTNGIGKLCKVVGEDGTVMTYEYDKEGRVTKETTSTTTGQAPATTQVSQSKSYTYFVGNTINTITYPSGDVVGYTYNQYGKNDKIYLNTALFATLSYNQDGLLTQIQYANGTSTKYTYNTNNPARIANLVTQSAKNAKVQSLTYTWDRSGNASRIVDDSNTDTAGTRDFTYDTLGRLTREKLTAPKAGKTYDKSYEYTGSGNILRDSDNSFYDYALPDGMTTPTPIVAPASQPVTGSNTSPQTTPTTPSTPVKTSLLNSLFGVSTAYADTLPPTSTTTTTTPPATSTPPTTTTPPVTTSPNTLVVDPATVTPAPTTPTTTVTTPDPIAVLLQQLITLLQDKLTVIKASGNGISVAPAGTFVPQSLTGKVTMKRRDKAVEVVFPKDFTYLPVVTTNQTSRISGTYWIDNITTHSFFLRLDSPQSSDVVFTWTAVEPASPDTLVLTTSAGLETFDEADLATLDKNDLLTTAGKINEYANPQAVTRVGTRVYSYSPNGDLIGVYDNGILTESLTYNGYGDLISYDNGKDKFTYTYNPLHQRIQINKGSNYTRTFFPDFIEDNDEYKVEISNGAVTLATVVTNKATKVKETLYYHSDLVGTTSVVTNQTGDVVSTTDSQAFGVVRNTLSTRGDTDTYYGTHRKDVGSRIILTPERGYDPVINRFLSLDPAALYTAERFVGDPQQLNLYSYARNNPVVYNDPSGACLEDLCVVEGLVYLAILYSPQITAYAQSLSSPLGQIGISQAMDDTSKGNYKMAVVGFALAGELPETKSGSLILENSSKGKLGEIVSGIEKNTERIPSMSGAAKYRIPDGLNHTQKILQEVKNTNRLYLSSQFKDYISYTESINYKIELITRTDTKISQPLADALNKVKATVKDLIIKNKSK